VLIARLTAQLRCYVPEPVDPIWARLRHLGARRDQLIGEASSQIQQIRDLLECVWPAALDTAQQPFRSQTWTVALTVIVDRDAGRVRSDPTSRAGPVRARSPPRDHPPRRAATLPADPAPAVHRADRSRRRDRSPHWSVGAGAAVAGRLAAHHTAAGRRRNADDRRARRARPTGLATSIPGLSAVGAAAILAQTGDPAASPPPAPWSNTPASPQGETLRRVRRPHQTSPARAGPDCGWPPGAPCGPPACPTPSMPPATCT
jgi:transposase